MMELLTTDEAARHLRMSERKLYDLVARNAIPCSKVTGRWLFPKAALDQWVHASISGQGRPSPPPIVGGSHDPLLEWALRESCCGLASLPEGSEAGLRRLSYGEVVAAAIHIHRLDGDDAGANADALAHTPGLPDAVLIAFAKREQGLLVAAGNPLGLTGIAAVASRRARLAMRPDGAGAQLLLLALLAAAGLKASALEAAAAPCPTGADIAQSVRAGRADCGIATRSVARAGLDFVPLAWEHFDLALRHRDYFAPPMQALLGFMRRPVFSERASELAGYDVGAAGTVRHVS